MQGIFITIEGMDGSGKTTQIEKLRQLFEKTGQQVVITREPGGTKISELIRQIVLDINHPEMDDTTEMLLYAAARAQHVHQLILPSLAAGKIVISDRYVDSSIVYQGYARGLGMEKVRLVNEIGTEKLLPEVTFFLDLDHASGMQRKKQQQQLDRLEAEKEKFHQRVREGFQRWGEQVGQRFVTIDAAASIDQIHNQIVAELRRRGILDGV